MKAAIVGLGSAGARHLNHLYDFGVREFVVCRSRGQPSPRPLRTENFSTVMNIESLWPHNPSLAVIANPTALHAEFARAFIQKSIPVYIEKPVDSSLEAALSLLDAAHTAKSLVCVGYQWRHHPTLKFVKENLARIGAFSSVLFESGEALPDYHPWEDYRESYAARRDQGGGVILTQSHDLDLLYHLFGPMKKIFAGGGRRSSLQMDVEDTAVVHLQTAQDVPLILRQDYLRRPAVRRLHVIGDQGQLHWDGFGMSSVTDAQGEVRAIADLPAGWTPEIMSRTSLLQFFESVKDRKTDPTSLQEGIEVLKIADAALRSIQTGEAISLR